MSIQYQYFPKSSRIPDFLSQLILVFQQKDECITSSIFQLDSNDVLQCLSDEIIQLGYKVEISKRANDKIRIPVLFGRNGALEKYFEVDCYNSIQKVVIEIEAGRAVSNYQFLKDLFQACVMQDVDYLVIAVRNIYRTSKDFDKVITFLDALYVSNRLILPLKGILIIGY
jgi:hypothetical protein